MEVVTPFAGVWIEIFIRSAISMPIVSSLPSRECGLKYPLLQMIQHRLQVTPFAGVWIEIFNGALIPGRSLESLPSRECGLK